MLAFVLPYLARALPVLGLLAALAGAGWWAYATGNEAGRAAVQADWDAERQLAAETRAQELRETVTRMDALHIEVERLRARPARVRTVVNTIQVKADEQCTDIHESLRSLWNAGG